MLAQVGAAGYGCGKKNAVIIDKTFLSIKAGENILLKADVAGRTDVEIVWQSADDSVAAVNDGWVTGVSRGETKIYASAKGVKKKAECKVAVTDDMGFAVKGRTFVYVGNTIELSAEITTDGVKVGVDGVEFRVISGGGCIALNGNLVTGVSEGEAVIRAVHSGYGLSAEHTVQVSDLIELYFEQNAVELKTFDFAGDLAAGKTTVELELHAFKAGVPISAGDIMWKSLNTKIATVQNGLVTFLTGGKVIITAQYGNVIENCVVTFNNLTGFTPIYNKNDLYLIDSRPDGNYVLMNDIDIGGEFGQDKHWAVEIFTGVFDGDGHKIYNFSITMGWGRGLFIAMDGTIRNLTVICNEFYMGINSGVLADTITDGIVENVSIHAEKIIGTSYAVINSGYSGLIAAYIHYGAARNCVVSGNWAPESYAGSEAFFAITHKSIGTLENVYALINGPSAFNGFIYAGLTKTVMSGGSINMFADGIFNITGSAYDIAGAVYTLTAGTAAGTALNGKTIEAGAAVGAAILRIALPSAAVNGTEPYIDVTVNVLAAGGLPAPTGISLNKSNLTWNGVALAAGYKVSVSFDGDAEETYTTSSASYDLADIFGDKGAGEYTVKVSALSGAGEYGGYSGAFTFTAIDDRTGFEAMTATGRYVLMNDIDMGGEAINWAVKIFNGVFDGNGHKIHNFSITQGWGRGLFISMDGTIKNLTVICNEFYMGIESGVLASTITYGEVENVFIHAEKIIGTSYAVTNSGYSGLIAGYIYYGAARNCAVSGNWAPASAAGSEAFFAITHKSIGTLNNVYALINGPSAFNGVTYDGLTKTVVNGGSINILTGGTFNITGSAYDIAGAVYTLAAGTAAGTALNGNTIEAGAAAGTATLKITLPAAAANGAAAYISVAVNIA